MKKPKVSKRIFQVILIVGLLFGAGILAWILDLTRPVAEQKQGADGQILVEVLPVRLRTVAIEIPSKGVVQAKKRTQLAAELAGKVISVSDKFISGGTFEKGEVILELDSSTYKAAEAQAEASLVEAEVALTTEKAMAEQAKRDWERLGQGKPSSLTLREPQILNASARVSAAKAALDKAKRDLERTIIRAPFNSTVSRKTTEIGNFLAPGAPIGEFFQTSPLEIRIPIPLDDVRFLNRSTDGDIIGDMTLSTTLGAQVVEWQARIDRTEGEVDQQSRSIYAVSEILPAQKKEVPVQLQPGLFLAATISGRKFDNIAVVPATAFLDLNRVVLVNSEDKLEFRQVDVMRRVGNHVYVTGGLSENERLCLTELSTMIEGTKVEARLIPPLEQAQLEIDNR